MMTLRTVPTAILAMLLMWSGCGGHTFWQTASSSSSTTNPTGAVPKFAFVANFNSGGAGSVSAYTISTSNGSLSAVAGSPFATGTGTVAVGADSGGKFVYAANQDGTVSAFTVNRTSGALTAVTGSPFTAGTKPAWVAVDPAARFVYVVNAGSSDISSYAVNSQSGALSGIGANTGLAAPPVRATIDPAGRFLYVSLGTGGTAVFKINSDGTLTAGVRTIPAAPCAASNSVAVDSNTRYAFVADGATGVCNYAVNASTGDWQLISSSVVAAGTKPVAVTSGGAGAFLLAANQGSNNVSGFLVNADGTLTAMAGSPFTAGGSPADIDVDPSGAFVYSANSGDGTISAYKISSNALTASGTASAGTNPSSIVTTQ